jgi:hypothetical protein
MRCDRCPHQIEVGETYIKVVFKPAKKAVGRRKAFVMTYRYHERCQHSPTPSKATTEARPLSRYEELLSA